MAYSFPWNNAVPAGTDPANQLDTFITDLKSAVSERMEDKFISSMTADPWVVKPEILGNVTGKSIILSANDFDWDDTSITRVGETEIITNNSGTVTGRCSFRLPLGITITEFRAIFEGNGTSTSTVELNIISYSITPTTTPVATLSRSNNSIGEESQIGLTQVVAVDEIYLVKVQLKQVGSSPHAGLLSVKIIYNTPDCRNTT